MLPPARAVTGESHTEEKDRGVKVYRRNSEKGQMGRIIGIERRNRHKS